MRILEAYACRGRRLKTQRAPQERQLLRGNWQTALALVMLCVGLPLLGSCGSSGVGAVTIQITPASVSGLDEGQPILLTATVGGDATNSGVTWTIPTSNTACSGAGCGTLTNSNNITTTFVAPSNLSTSLSVTIQAASVVDPAVIKTVAISIVLPPTFSTTGLTECAANVYCLPNGANGVSYNGKVTASGGVAPLVFSVPANSLPAGLSMNNTGQIIGRPSGPTVAQPNPVIFTVTVTDTPVAPATPISVTQQFEISVAPAPALSITSSPQLPAGFINAKYGASVATVGGVPPLTWSVLSGTLPPGLNFGTNTGQVTGIPTAAAQTGSPYSFTVQVQDSALPTPQTQKTTLSLQIEQPPALAITTTTLPTAFTASAYNGSLQASGGIPPYTWSITSGQLPSGLTFGSNGAITGTPIFVTSSPAQFTVEVQDSELNPATGQPAPASATQTLHINVDQGANSNTSLVSGTYVFLFNGFDSQGTVAIAGTLTAAGNGTISSGVEDSNRVSGVVNGAGLTGSYSLGSDGRGTMQIIATNPITQVTLTTNYQMVMESDGSLRFFENDTTGTRGTGILKLTQAASFTAANFSGNYSFELAGQDSTSNATVLGGVISADGSSTLSNGIGDFNEGGTFSPAIDLSGTFASGGMNRSEATITYQLPQKTQVTLSYFFYFASSGDVFFVSSDPTDATHPRLSGEFIQQNPTVQFNNSALNGTSVITGTGLSGANASVFAGLFTGTIAPSGSTSDALSYDENDGGTITTPAPSFPCAGCATPTFSVASNGRATFTNLAASGAQPRLAVAYLTGQGQGFIMGSDAAVTVGRLEAQQPPITPATTFLNADVEGQYTLSAPATGDKQVPNVIGESFASGTGGLTGILDEIDPTSPNLDQSLVVNYNVAANGRGTMVANSLVGFPVNLAFYVVSPGTLRLVSLDSNPGNGHPQVIFLDH
jgi:Putative Ig domain